MGAPDLPRPLWHSQNVYGEMGNRHPLPANRWRRRARLSLRFLDIERPTHGHPCPGGITHWHDNPSSIADKFAPIPTVTPPRVDAHLHLPRTDSADESFFIHAQAATEIGILAINSTCEQDWTKLILSARRYNKVIPFLGIHPWWANDVSAGWQERLKTNLIKTTFGIGEIGLDALSTTPVDIQEAIFIPQLEMAEDMGRMVSIHCCRRWGRLLDLLTATCKGDSKIIIHGFNGSLEIMHRLLNLGAMLSFGTSLEDPAKIKIRQAFQKAPLDRILLESDWPSRLSAKKNCPAATTHHIILADLYSVAAELKAISIEQLQTTVWENGQIFTH